MTNARASDSPHRAAGQGDLLAGRAVTAGKYIYTPGVADSTLQMRGSLHRDGARVELCVTDSLLRDFLALLGVAQEELNQRWNGQEISDFYADRARRR